MDVGTRGGELPVDDVDELTARLTDDSASVRMDAAWTLAEIAVDSPALVAPVADSLALFDDPNDWTRRGAAWALAEVGAAHPSVLKPLLGALRSGLGDEDRLVRENAAAAVAAVATEYPRAARSATDALVPLLSDEDQLVRRYAAEALVAIGDVSPAQRDAIYPHLTDLDADIDLPAGANVIEREPTPERWDRGSTREETEETGTEETEQTATKEVQARQPAAASPGRPPDHVPTVGPASLSFDGLKPVAPIASNRYVLVRAARCARPEERLVALTTVRHTAIGDGFADEFARGMRYWQGIHDHDHVATVVDWGERPRYWAAVEYLDSGTLADRYGHVGDAEALWIARALARTVTHAHAQGVLHLGLTPASVRFADSLSGAWIVPKVTDWGLAAAIREYADVDNLAPRYAAPEQRRDGFGASDHLTDVYRLGVLLFELFAGSPFRPTDEVTPPGLSNCPEPVRPILARALAGPKTERYESVADLRRDLDVLAEQSK